MAGILKITSHQLRAFQLVDRAQLIDRIDDWLCGELEGWNRAIVPKRHLIIDEICRLADESGFEIEMDYAVLCYSALSMRGQWKTKLYSDEWLAILRDNHRNPSSKARTVFLFSESENSHDEGRLA